MYSGVCIRYENKTDEIWINCTLYYSFISGETYTFLYLPSTQASWGMASFLAPSPAELSTLVSCRLIDVQLLRHRCDSSLRRTGLLVEFCLANDVGSFDRLVYIYIY